MNELSHRHPPVLRIVLVVGFIICDPYNATKMIPTITYQSYITDNIKVSNIEIILNGNVLPTNIGKLLPSIETFHLIMRNI
jgi:hypothetical protein